MREGQYAEEFRHILTDSPTSKPHITISLEMQFTVFGTLSNKMQFTVFSTLSNKIF
jgi:hypothetical protein